MNDTEELKKHAAEKLKKFYGILGKKIIYKEKGIDLDYREGIITKINDADTGNVNIYLIHPGEAYEAHLDNGVLIIKDHDKSRFKENVSRKEDTKDPINDEWWL